jgi:hypothetical protein
VCMAISQRARHRRISSPRSLAAGCVCAGAAAGALASWWLSGWGGAHALRAHAAERAGLRRRRRWRWRCCLGVGDLAGEPQRLVIESRWSHFSSECQRLGHPLRLNHQPLWTQPTLRVAAPDTTVGFVTVLSWDHLPAPYALRWDGVRGTFRQVFFNRVQVRASRSPRPRPRN